MPLVAWVFPLLATAILPAQATPTEAQGKMTAATFAGLPLRPIGPALSSGRVVDLAVDPADPARWFIAVASGGVWRTTNNGTTFTPLFDAQASYSIGCVRLAPDNPHVVWVGTGENNSQRAVAFGDGVYRSRDDGQHWERMGLEDSEHIGMIAIDPRDADVVYVAAQGPLWRSGGQRGVFKTTDGGKTWTPSLTISEHTGANEVHLDPRDPDVLYATSYQRRRHVWTLIDGGPESTIYKSTDAGATWRKVEHGLPEVEKGRIGLAVSPANPDVLYAIVEAQLGKGGTYRSTDRGETWTRRSDKVATSPQYYNELVCDPRDVDTVYCLDTITTVSRDGGATWTALGNLHRHVDDHALWIDPRNTRHLLIGGDGGIYETWDGGAHFDFKENLPVTQFYRVAVDQALPFYNVYGGTQDNNSLGGPSRTNRLGGITNDDWFVTVSGDGYEVQVDSLDPNLVYTMWQYGGLVRLDRRSGELVDIKPREGAGDAPLKWNWDSPLLLSAHAPTRLYFAANKLFRSDDRGDTWRAISGDLTRGLDRDQLEVMGRVWEADAVAKNASTSFYGNCVSLAESPLDERVLFAGTDDGLVHVTSDGGASWTKLDTFPGVPERTYVSCLMASRFDPSTVYAAFDNHKNGDFKPYLLLSQDRGRSWTSLVGDLPARDTVYTIVQDHVRRDLLFVGTEFGVYFTLDHGAHWIRLQGGMPTIAVRDLELQRREDDLVVGTFGRGIYILDDYSALRGVSEATLTARAHVFPVRRAPLYVPANRLGMNTGLGSQGSTYFAADNPPFGALITYHLANKIETRREQRLAAEKRAREKGERAPYPTADALRAEDQEVEPQVLATVRDAQGQVVRRVPASREAGLHRVAFDLRHAPLHRVETGPRAPGLFETPTAGPLVLAGSYTVALDLVTGDGVTQLTGPVPFEVVPLDLQTLAAEDKVEALAFQQKVVDLRRTVNGARAIADETGARLAQMRLAVQQTPKADLALLGRIDALAQRTAAMLVELQGDTTRARRDMPTVPSLQSRVDLIADALPYTTARPTRTQRDSFAVADATARRVLAELRALTDEALPQIDAELEKAGAPWTARRIPR